MDTDGSARLSARGEDIVEATNATPIVITTATTNAYRTGDLVRISDVLGNTAANGEWTVTNINTTTFSLNGSVGNGAYLPVPATLLDELAASIRPNRLAVKAGPISRSSWTATTTTRLRRR